MTREMSIAEGLVELKLIKKKLILKYANITRYCSKRKGSQDEMKNQKEYVVNERLSAEDLLKNYLDIKVAINKTNLEAGFEFDGKKYTIFEAIQYKHFLKDQYKYLYAAFNTDNAEMQLSKFRRLDLTETTTAELNLVPELYYDEKEIQQSKEKLLTLMSYLDALIDKTNHATMITIA